MEKGEIVKIHFDPLIQELEEGEAELIERKIIEYDMEFWKVQFCSDGFFADRWIAKNAMRLSKRIY